MKLAMIGLRGIPAKSGGVENVIEALAPRLVKLGMEVTVYCRNPYCKEKPKEYKGVKLKYLPTLNTKHTEAIIHTKLSSLNAMFSNYDIVHYHAMGNGLLSFMPRITGKKTIVTLHGLDYEREKWGFMAKTYLKICEKAISIFPNKVTAVSEKIKEHYQKKYKKQIEFIPNGVEIVNPRPINSLKKFHLKKGTYILFLSRIVPEKGLHFLIEAFKDIKTDLKLVIAGDATHTDKYADEVKSLAKDDKRIIFTGALYGNDKTEAYSNALFFVLPSTIEGMPIVLLEAMSFGLCPLVSDIKENTDVIKDNGYSFKSKDVNDLREKLIFMIKNPKEIAKKAISSKKLVEAEYNWDEIAKRYYKMYQEVENGKKP